MTVRSISKKIGYSTIKIYSDYGSKENLLLEIQKGGFQKINKKYNEAIIEGGINEENLVNVSCAHVLFSQENKALYDLMYSLNGANCIEGAFETKRKVAQVIQQFLDPLHPYDKNTIFFHYYALIHGLAITIRDIKLLKNNDLSEYVRLAIQNFIKGIN